MKVNPMTIAIDPWQEEPSIVYNTDLNDERVFAILSADYLKLGDLPLLESVDLQDNLKLATAISSDYQALKEDYDRANGLSLTKSSIPDDPDDTDTHFAIKDPQTGELLGYISKEDGQWSDDALQPGYSPRNTQQQESDIFQPNNARLLDIVKRPSTLEYRWSYDGHQLHIWRVYNRSSYGPSHYDMFGSEGYEQHSQGRVYVDAEGHVGVLYWQISHPECEQVLNEWVEKTFGKMPDYVYRAYGPYAGEVRPRWMFPIVEVSGLPLTGKERWWEDPSRLGPSWYEKELGIGKKDYPAKKQPAQFPGPVDNSGLPINPNKKKRRRPRRRNRKYRNRSYR